jgi:hypothetical protein
MIRRTDGNSSIFRPTLRQRQNIKATYRSPLYLRSSTIECSLPGMRLSIICKMIHIQVHILTLLVTWLSTKDSDAFENFPMII